MSNRPIKHGDKTLFHNGVKFFEDLQPSEYFKTKHDPTIYQAIEGGGAIEASDTETKPKWFNSRMPVQTLKAF